MLCGALEKRHGESCAYALGCKTMTIVNGWMCFSATIVSGLKAEDLQQFVGEKLFSSPFERYSLKKLNNLSEHSKSRAVGVRRILEHKKHRLLASFIDTLRCKQA